mmetsp:Transcript_64406/g.153630  ORF Transcript_64406/g.153630 Transcript_64406/m.153630 type:complete len:132 (+) Transcript_64406:2667-3062(+)
MPMWQDPPRTWTMSFVCPLPADDSLVPRLGGAGCIGCALPLGGESCPPCAHAVVASAGLPASRLNVCLPGLRGCESSSVSVKEEPDLPCAEFQRSWCLSTGTWTVGSDMVLFPAYTLAHHLAAGGCHDTAF